MEGNVQNRPGAHGIVLVALLACIAGPTHAAESPTIFLRAVGADLQPGTLFHASGHYIDMVPVLAARDQTAWCAWDSLLWDRSELHGKSLFVRRVEATARKGKPVPIAEKLEHICSPSFAWGPKGRTVLVWCEKQRGKDWELKKSECDKSGRWSKGQSLVTGGNLRYCCAVFDTRGDLWISYTADTEEGRQVKVERPEATHR